MKLEKGTFGTFPASLAKGRHPIQQALLAWLWFHKNADGVSFPSHKTLAEEAGLGKKPDRNADGKCVDCGKIDERCECLRKGGVTSVKEHLGKLEKAGLITRTRRQKPGKKENDSTLYGIQIFPIPEGSEEPLPEDGEVGRHATEGVGHVATEVGRQTADGVGRQTASNQIHLELDSVTSSAPIGDGEDGGIRFPDGYQLAQVLFDAMRKNNPTSLPAVRSARDQDEHLAKWAADFDKVLRIDRRPLGDARRVLEWSQQDEFWKCHIQSPTQFRKKYDTLYMRCTTAASKSSTVQLYRKNGSQEEVTEQYIDELRKAGRDVRYNTTKRTYYFAD